MVTEEEEEKVDRGERVAIYAIKSAPQNCGVGGDGTPLPSGGLCVIQGIDPPFGLNALFRSFFCSPSSLCPVGWRRKGDRKKASLKATGAKKVLRAATMSRAFLRTRVRVTRPLCVRA